MNSEIYAAMPTERLVDLFVAAAKQTGAGRLFSLLEDMRNGAPPPPAQPITPESRAAAAKVREIGPVLDRRLSIEQIHGLMDDEDNNVRTCAAGQFYARDSEWSQSASTALAKNLPTRDVVGFRARARQPPPAKPGLKDMTDDQLVARFEDAATRLDLTQFLDWVGEPDDLELRNDIISECGNVGSELKTRGQLERLLPLLDSANDCIRCQAALFCLRIAEAQAVAVLEAIAAKNNFDESITAKDALDWHRKEHKP
jgi:HEAT repeat protein